MPSKELFGMLKDAHPSLQASLDKGWAEFKDSHGFSVSKNLYHQMDWWYTSKYYGVIPNPGHWYSSQQLASYFLVEMGKLGIYFDTMFPGNFPQSKETEREDGLDVRVFQLTVFHEAEPVCIFQLDFIHSHGEFYFTYPPQLSILELPPTISATSNSRLVGSGQL